MCLYPKLIKNPKYKNGNKPLRDERLIYVPIGCNNCMECAKKKANGWKIRLKEEIKDKSLKSYFVTLTFNSESLKEIDDKIDKGIKGYNRDNAIATKAIRLFTERWRKKYKKSIRHWIVTELGHESTEHIHMHGIIRTNMDFEEIRRIWKYGFVYPRDYQIETNYVNEKTINYIVKYITKVDVKHPSYRQVILCSNGIGNNWKASKYEISKDRYKLENGKEIGLPIYYRNKMYNETEREELWIKKIDEGIRYINGSKVKASEIELINRLLKEGQEISENRGYKGNTLTWQEKEYENQQRDLLRRNRYEKKIW